MPAHRPRKRIRHQFAASEQYWCMHASAHLARWATAHGIPRTPGCWIRRTSPPSADRLPFFMEITRRPNTLYFRDDGCSTAALIDRSLDITWISSLVNADYSTRMAKVPPGCPPYRLMDYPGRPRNAHQALWQPTGGPSNQELWPTRLRGRCLPTGSKPPGIFSSVSNQANWGDACRVFPACYLHHAGGGRGGGPADSHELDRRGARSTASGRSRTWARTTRF